jgi:hypothetical protein
VYKQTKQTIKPESISDYDFDKMKQTLTQDRISNHPRDIKLFKTYDIRSILNQKTPVAITAQ